MLDTLYSKKVKVRLPDGRQIAVAYKTRAEDVIKMLESEEKAKEDFERLKRRDNIKNNYCAKNNITLIRIPYWEVNNISVLLDKIFNKGRI